MVPQIPYAGIGIGIAVIFGVWAFLVAETRKERAYIAGIPVVVFLIRIILPSLAGQLISLIGWILYGLGCIIYLRYNGMVIR
jgi:predicted tellurium resistance membrane protein TerC